MTRRWVKIRKRLVRACLPPLRWVSPRLAARLLMRIGRVEHALVPGVRHRIDAAVQEWSEHLGVHWDRASLARELAANEVRWQSRDLVLDGLPDGRFAELFRVEGLDHLESAHARGRGVVLLANHYGSHLVPMHWLHRQGYPVRVYMERPHSISRFLARHFAEDGPLGQAKLFISRKASAAESASSVLRAVKVLKAGMILCLAGDVRWSGPNTASAQFLGKTYSFTSTWVILAAMTGAPVVPVFCRMTPDGRFALEFRPPFELPPKAARPEEVAGHVRAYLETIEDQLRHDPANGNEYVGWLDSRQGATSAKR